MATESHAQPSATFRPERPERPDRPGRHVTHELSMTTREKVMLETPYDAVFEVESGNCTLNVIDVMHAEIVSDDKPGDSRISVTPTEPHDDHVPAMVLCHVAYPVTALVVGTAVPK